MKPSIENLNAQRNELRGSIRPLKNNYDRMKKTLCLLLVITTIFSLNSSAQSMGSSYQTAVGIKFWPGAISVKHFISDNNALEGLANFWDRGFRLTGLYEIHGDINDVEGLKWYVGLLPWLRLQ